MIVWKIWIINWCKSSKKINSFLLIYTYIQGSQECFFILDLCYYLFLRYLFMLYSDIFLFYMNCIFWHLFYIVFFSVFFLFYNVSKINQKTIISLNLLASRLEPNSHHHLFSKITAAQRRTKAWKRENVQHEEHSKWKHHTIKQEYKESKINKIQEFKWIWEVSLCKGSRYKWSKKFE